MASHVDTATPLRVHCASKGRWCRRALADHHQGFITAFWWELLVDPRPVVFSAQAIANVSVSQLVGGVSTRDPFIVPSLDMSSRTTQSFTRNWTATVGAGELASGQLDTRMAVAAWNLNSVRGG